MKTIKEVMFAVLPIVMIFLFVFFPTIICMITEDDLKNVRFEYDGYYSNIGDYNPRGCYGVLSFKCVNKPTLELKMP